MVNWFTRRVRRSDVPRLKPRGEASTVVKVDLAELTPELIPYLGQAAYLQLVIFQTLSGVVAQAPTLASKESVSRVAALSLAKHHGLIDEIVRTGAEPGATMQPYAASIDNFARVTAGADWHEMLVSSYVTAGLLDDFSKTLASNLQGDAASRISALLAGDDGHILIASELSAAIAQNPVIAHRLAMWGRRLVGDTLLVARSALNTNSHPDEARLEPIFSELIAAHTRRMDALGLTA